MRRSKELIRFSSETKITSNSCFLDFYYEISAFRVVVVVVAVAAAAVVAQIGFFADFFHFLITFLLFHSFILPYCFKIYFKIYYNFFIFMSLKVFCVILKAAKCDHLVSNRMITITNYRYFIF